VETREVIVFIIDEFVLRGVVIISLFLTATAAQRIAKVMQHLQDNGIKFNGKILQGGDDAQG